SGNQLRKWCREHFLSFLRMREWQDLHHQLTRSVRELDLRPNHTPASYADLHQAILTGFLGSVGTLNQKREYDGPRGMRFVVAPGSPLAAKPPKWLVAGSLIETTRLYARMVASINPAWIEWAGAHLVKRTHSEPHWVADRGFVAAYESVSLYGLSLATRRRVNYGPVAPQEARAIFIREALLAPAAGIRNARVGWEFLEANRRLREQIERLEAKIRRRDILVGEESEVDFYATRIPERVSSVGDFEQWRAGRAAGAAAVVHVARGSNETRSRRGRRRQLSGCARGWRKHAAVAVSVRVGGSGRRGDAGGSRPIARCVGAGSAGMAGSGLAPGEDHRRAARIAEGAA
ncbi:MAG: DUF3418 domain-containing protein, partial [Gammaproteobacteria bacterium]|nr:DUF3418 domain-containing protein [Gammaproteobacteria bacterium]